MTIRKILTEPNKVLRQKSTDVKKVDQDIQKILDDMLETMYHASGIGLAAIQIGIPKRLIVLDISKQAEPKKPMFFVNPEIIWKSEQNSTYEEGCLSVPDQFAEIDRPKPVLDDPRTLRSRRSRFRNERRRPAKPFF